LQIKIQNYIPQSYNKWTIYVWVAWTWKRH